MNPIKLASPVSLLAMAVGVVVSGTAYSNFQKSQSESKSPEKKSSFSLTTEVVEEEETKCIIYVVNHPVSSYTVTEILAKKGRNKFLKGIDQTQASFVEEINDACENRKNKRSVRVGENFQVYVYKSNEKWQYAYDLQKRDWTKANGVINRTIKNQ